DAARRLGRWEAAARALERAVPRAPAAARPALQLERAKLLVRSGRRREPLALFAEVAATGSDADAAEALYQRGRLLEDMDRTPAAPSGAPGAEDVASSDASVTLPAEPREAVAGDPAFARVELLRRLGLVQYAVEELEVLTPRAAADPARLYAVSSVYAQEARY